MRSLRNKYYFTVEGHNEDWYFDHLKELIEGNSNYLVKFVKKCQYSPLKFAKRYSSVYNSDLWHIRDFESKEPEFQKIFKSELDELKEVNKTKTGVSYYLGYSNLCFELWMILHKMDFSVPLNNRKQYLQYINSAYKQNYKKIDDYKDEKEFKKILNSITLNDVKDAVRRAKTIEEKCKYNTYKLIEHSKGISYYQENPSLSIHKFIEKILNDTKIII